jgi:hypothetical protein
LTLAWNAVPLPKIQSSPYTFFHIEKDGISDLTQSNLKIRHANNEDIDRKGRRNEMNLLTENRAYFKFYFKNYTDASK